MSSSRLHCTNTGAPTCFDRYTASSAKSHFDLRPKAPPNSVTFTRICSGLKPVTASAIGISDCGSCVGAQISQRSAVTAATATNGSIGACASSGA
jgi:hypothetical protein